MSRLKRYLQGLVSLIVASFFIYYFVSINRNYPRLNDTEPTSDVDYAKRQSETKIVKADTVSTASERTSSLLNWRNLTREQVSSAYKHGVKMQCMVNLKILAGGKIVGIRKMASFPGRNRTTETSGRRHVERVFDFDLEIRADVGTSTSEALYERNVSYSVSLLSLIYYKKTCVQIFAVGRLFR